MDKKFIFSKEFFKDAWVLTKAYFTGDDWKRAWLLFVTVMIMTLGIVYMLVQLNLWYNSFYSALQEYNSEKIYSELWRFTWLAFIYIFLAVAAYYLRQSLIMHWREWLTVRFIDEWLKNKTYYNLQMFGASTDNPDQRISEDVKLFVTMTLSLFVDFIKALTTLLSFIAILYTLSGVLDVNMFGRTWHIHGYLFWASFVYACIGTWLAHVVGKKLVELNYVQQRYEADFRFSMIRMREAAESVAFYRGEDREQGILVSRFKDLLDNFWRLVNRQKWLILFNSVYGQLAIIFPFVVAMSRYLAKEFTLGGLMQVSSAFGRVQDSLSFFVDSYASIAEWQAVTMRLSLFYRHMNNMQDQVADYKPEFRADEVVGVEGLTVSLPGGRVLVHDANFVLQPHSNVLIKGPSGCGKSTLLRAISGIWPYVAGKIILPPQEKIMFIPQKPYLPLGTLKEVLTYPSSRADDATIKLMMARCKIEYLSDKLEEMADWSHVLSVGEQQRVAFARALLIAPEWLFLDEATSALDETTEKIMYENLGEYLAATTVVSIGHRSTLMRFHRMGLTIREKQCYLEQLEGTDND